MPKPILTSGVLAGLVVFGYYSIMDLMWRNGLAAHLEDIQKLPGAPLPDALDVPGVTSFVGVEAIDHTLTVLVRFFWPCVNGQHPALSLLSILFCGQVFSLHSVLILEGLRAGNKFTVFWPASIWAQIYQLIPVGITAPVWTLAHVWRSPISQLSTQASPAKKAELLAMDSTKLAAYPLALIMGFGVPTALAGWPGLLGVHTQQVVLALWQAFPFWVGLWLFDIVVFISPWDLVPAATQTSPAANLRWAGYVYGIILTLTAATHLTTLGYIIYPEYLTNLFPGLDVSSITAASTLVPMSFTNPHQVANIAEGVLTLLQYDMYSSTTAIFVWSLYQVYSLDNSISAVVNAVVKSLVRVVFVGPAGAALWNIWDRDAQVAKAAAIDTKKTQ